MQQMDLIFTTTADDLKLPGFYYPVDNKDLCVLFVHGMSGFILENYFGHVLGQELQSNGVGYIFTHNRGYAHINDIRTSEKNPDGGFKSRRNGAVYERFECKVVGFVNTRNGHEPRLQLSHNYFL